MSADQDSCARDVAIRAAWWRWTLMFVPLMIVTGAGLYFYGLATVLTLLMAVLAATLLYQRFVNKRSWHAIFWGVYAAEK